MVRHVCATVSDETFSASERQEEVRAAGRVAESPIVSRRSCSMLPKLIAVL